MRKLALVLYLSLAGCCDNSLATVRLSFSGETGTGFRTYLWTGDTATLFAVAGTKPVQYCYRDLYTSTTDPDRFSYNSTDSTTVSLTKAGLLNARRLGLAALTAISGGVQSESLTVVVAPPIFAIAPSPEVSPAKIGDTVTIRVDALDSLGASVPEAQLNYSVQQPQDTVAVLLTPLRSRLPLTTIPAPFSLSFLARHAGTAVITFSAPHALPHVPQLTRIAVINVVAP